MSEEEKIDCQLEAFEQFLSKYHSTKASKKLLFSKGYFKPAIIAKELGVPIKKFYFIHNKLCTRVLFRCQFYYKKL